MPQHEVKMTVPATTQVVNADVTFVVAADGRRLGTLQISKGSIDWKPAGAQHSHSATWEEFDRWMREG